MMTTGKKNIQNPQLFDRVYFLCSVDEFLYARYDNSFRLIYLSVCSQSNHHIRQNITSELIPNGFLDLPDALGAFDERFFLRVSQREDSYPLNTVAGDAARDAEEDVFLDTV